MARPVAIYLFCNFREVFFRHRKGLVDLGRFELPTPWLQIKRKDTILLARFAFCSVTGVGFTRYSGGFVPLLFP